MKFLDLWVGGPVCLALAFLHGFARAILGGRRPPDTITKILVMKFFGMGSILLASPLFKALRRRHPEARIGFLTFAENRDLCEITRLADEYYCLRTKNILVFLLDLLKAILAIRKRGYDMAVDMEFFSNFSMLMSALSGARIRVGYYARRPGRESLLDRPVYFNQRKHVTEVFLSLAGEDRNASGSDAVPDRLMLPEESRENASLLLGEFGLDGNHGPPVVALNVNAGELCLERRWPGEYFIEFSEMLLRTTRAVLFFIGGKEDAGYVDVIVSSLEKNGRYNGRVRDLAGRLSLGDLIGLLEKCDLLITNDSGPLHLAVGAGTRTASFFGPETPALYGPPGGGRHLVFYKALYCSPCLNVYNAKTAVCNGDNRCMSVITPDEAYTAIKDHFPDLWR